MQCVVYYTNNLFTACSSTSFSENVKIVGGTGNSLFFR